MITMDTARRIADHLPEWRAEEDTWNPAASQLSHPDGRRIRIRPLHPLRDLGRLAIEGQAPSAVRGALARTQCQSITVRADRDPAAIAREICRRLLPAYTDEFTALAEQADRIAKAEASRTEITARLASLLPQFTGQAGILTHRSVRGRERCRAVVSADAVTLELTDLTPDIAYAVLTAYTQAIQDRTAAQA